MRCTILSTVLFVLIGLFLSLGCSSGKIPSVPDLSTRGLDAFNSSWLLWETSVLTKSYKEVDLAVVTPGTWETGDVQKRDYPAEIFYQYMGNYIGCYFTLEVSVEQNVGDDPSINYAWLDDFTSPSTEAPMRSGAFYTFDGTQYQIAAAKVAISHYSTQDTIDATVAFMVDADGDWDIGVVTGHWDAVGFPMGDFVADEPVIFDDEHEDDEETTNDYHPDIAWDPMTDDLHLVWTGYTGEDDHPYRLNYRTYDSSETTWGDQQMIYEDDKDYAAWAPRIAVGNAGGGLGETVGIVYSSFSSLDYHYAKDHWHCGGAY